MKRMAMTMMAAMLIGGAALQVCAQEAAAPAAPGDAGALVQAPGTAKPAASSGNNFIAVLFGTGILGFLLWVALFASGGVAMYFAVDSALTVRDKRIMPQSLVDNVTQAMSEGDVLKALKHCENEPGPLANILTAGFSHVEEGFDVIQEAIATAAELETEKIMQKLTWMSVMSNLAPMLGLLGTVQGMIAAFANLAGGAPDVGLLALNISQALYTTAAGLVVAVPTIAVYYSFRNTANRIVLKMEAMTMELIKDLRNVEVVEG